MYIFHDSDEVVFLSGRQKGLIEGINHLFPYTYCLLSSQRQYAQAIQTVDLKNLLWKVARATIETNFNKCLQDMKAINTDCID